MSGTILLVEDNEDDVFLMKRALREAGITNPLRVLNDGLEAIDYLGGTGPFAQREPLPAQVLVLLDLKLPRRSGHEVLEWIRQQPQFAKLIVIILTSSSEPVDLNRAYRAGANSYVVKPPTATQLLELTEAFKLWWLTQDRVGSSKE
jgi:CheY-like chemotaxis protein